jgi:hypothetical protein
MEFDLRHPVKDFEARLWVAVDSVLTLEGMEFVKVEKHSIESLKNAYQKVEAGAMDIEKD